MKKSWMTSSEPSVRRTGRPIGTCSSLISRTPSGCCTFHIHCLPTTNTSIELAGGLASRKNIDAPQTNMTIDSTNGMNVQASSSDSEPWMSAPTSSAWRRRYFSVKNTTSAATSTVKNAQTATMNR